MEGVVDMTSGKGEYEAYPLFTEGEEIGALLVRPLEREGLITKSKEQTFRKRGWDFLAISFLIAGGGALFLSVIFSVFLSTPVRRLTAAADEVAKGNLDVRVAPGSRDEIGRLAASFNRMVETLKREEILRKQLTSNIAHELRTPLTIMKATVEALVDGVVTDAEEGLGKVRDEVEKLTGLVQGIEDLTKAEASFFSPGEYEEVSLGGFLEGIVRGMKPLFTEKGLDLSVAGEGDPVVKADVEKLEKVIRNLLSNALRHTRKGGAEIRYGTDGSGFTLSVADTGEGIAEEELPHIFTRFFTGKGSEGTGLGLAICHELVRVMGGTMEVESSLGQGTVFTVSLPSGRPEHQV